MKKTPQRNGCGVQVREAEIIQGWKSGNKQKLFKEINW